MPSASSPLLWVMEVLLNIPRFALCNLAALNLSTPER